MAAQENHLEVVKFLLENGANQSLPTEVCIDKLIIGNHLLKHQVCLRAVMLFIAWKLLWDTTECLQHSKLEMCCTVKQNPLNYGIFMSTPPPAIIRDPAVIWGNTVILYIRE